MKLGDSESGISTDDRFRAFVSYSHADAKFAHRLHRKMETYRLPARFRGGQDGADSGLSNGRLGKIFRDRDDLPASQDLSEAVKSALEASQALIVLCSPDAKASPWVSQEIELFRSLHPDRPILAALIRGEPEEAFPAALLDGNEPLAADLRREGDGWRLGFLKIVAGIAGISLDSLVQRDAQRRMHRVMAITGGALIALLAMIGMTIFAIQQRNEAQHQRAEAEGMVEYMLTDLRSELKGASTLRVMTKVNERAMDYYKGQGDLSDLPAESLERRARILHAMGEDDEKRGDLDKALVKFKEAHRVTEALLARDPDNPDRIFGHAQSEYWVGYVAYLKKDWKQTEKYWRGYKKLADLLVVADDQNPKWLREAGYAEGNLCTFDLALKGRMETALESCGASLRRMQSVFALNPTDTQAIMDVANRHAWMADAYKALNNRSEELNQRYHREELANRLIAMEPNNLDFRDIWLVVQSEIARLEEQDKGKKRLEKAIEEANNMIAHDPQNKIWRNRLVQIEKISSKLNQGE